MKRIITGVMVLAASAVLLPGVANARPQYLQAFTKVYSPKADSNLGKAKCGICHTGADKTVRNDYGKALQKALGKEKATAEEAETAIKKIAKEKSADKKNTFGQLIKEDKLPGEEKK